MGRESSTAIAMLIKIRCLDTCHRAVHRHINALRKAPCRSQALCWPSPQQPGRLKSTAMSTVCAGTGRAHRGLHTGIRDVRACDSASGLACVRMCA